MLFSKFMHACTFLALNRLGSLASPLLESHTAGISQAIFDDLVRYTKYSSAAYQLVCLNPVGNTLVKAFSRSSTQGYVARDDRRKEIVVAFRGTSSPQDAIVDLDIIRIPFRSVGITGVGNASVHEGFLHAYNVVADEVLGVVKGQLAAHRGYSLVVTGHSLGGALASIAVVSINAAKPSVPIKLYTYGQPRVGDAAFAKLVESRIGISNIFRAVHTTDGVPTILSRILGYHHFATEYWNFRDPASPANVRKCLGRDDPNCSASILSTGINVPHTLYFGQAMALDPLLCLA